MNLYEVLILYPVGDSNFSMESLKVVAESVESALNIVRQEIDITCEIKSSTLIFKGVLCQNLKSTT